MNSFFVIHFKNTFKFKVYSALGKKNNDFIFVSWLNIFPNMTPLSRIEMSLQKTVKYLTFLTARGGTCFTHFIQFLVIWLG